MFDLELERVRKEVLRRKCRKVLIHLPEGLMPKADEIVKAIPCEALLWAKPSYGACDLPVWAPLGFDLIIAYGHSGKREGVLFIEAKSDREVKLESIPPGKIGLIYTIQFREQAMKIRDELEKKGKKVLLGKHGQLTNYDGQVTGCDIGSALSVQEKVDSFLFIGEGSFHEGALCLKRPVFDAKGGEIKAKRKNRPALVLSLNRFGILVSIKPGQRHEALARKVKAALEKMGKTVYTIVGDDFDPRISNFPVDAFVTCACPRLADDAELFGRPILSAEEVLEAASE